MKKKEGILPKLAYACGDIYGGGSFLIVGVLILVFLTDVEGLSGTLAGLVILIGKVWDAVTDPFMGILSDRTRSRFGRRRIYFLFGSIPVLLSWVMLWYSFGISGTIGKFIYYTLAYIFFSTAFTIVMVPYNALLAEMTTDYNMRSSFTGVRLGFSAAAAIICGLVPAMITGAFEDPAKGYLAMAIIFAILFATAWILVYLGTWENTRSTNAEGFAWKDWLSVFKNKSFRYYIRIFVSSQMAIDITMALAVYFLNVSIRKEHLFVPTMAGILGVQLLFIGVFSVLAQKTNKKIPAIIGAVTWITATLILTLFTPQTPDLVIIILCSFIGIGAAGCNFISWSILPDISDVDELMTGKRREGLYSGVSTFMRKMAGGLAVGGIGPLLDIFKYSDQAVKSGQIEPITDIGIKLMFCIIPILFLLFMLYSLRGYKLGKEEYGLLHKLLANFRDAETEVKLEPEAIQVGELLTGAKSETFYGK